MPPTNGWGSKADVRPGASDLEASASRAAGPDLPATWTVHEGALASFKRGIERDDGPAWFQLRAAAERIALVPGFQDLIALGANAIEEFPHQSDVALRALRDMGGRAILADEVGLGKTIEAGLILKELIVRGLARRVLIITPASLVTQWHAELETKFFERFDLPERPDDWRGTQRAIVSIERARNRRHAPRVTADEWDLVVVDEAHKARNRRSASYRLLERLRRHYLLLLTATPLQNDLRELYNLVTLLRPGQLGTWREFKREFVDARDPRKAVDPERIRELTGEVMIRTRRASVDLNLPRRLPEHPDITLTAPEQDLYLQTSGLLRALYRHGFHERTVEERARDSRRSKRGPGKGLFRLEMIRLAQRLCSSSPALAASLENKAKSELIRPEYRAPVRDLAAAARAVNRHAKLDALGRVLSTHRERVLVFTEHLPTLRLIRGYVAGAGRRPITFHGRLSRGARAARLRAFRDSADAVFIATRSGTEGLNLQFANVLVNYELPWNPMLVEQRIGRLHRIGQKRDVHIVNFAASGTVEQRVLAVLDRKIRLFELVVGELDVILGRFGEDEEQSLEMRFGGAWLDADDDAAFEIEVERVAREIEESRHEGRENERRSSEIAPPDPGEVLARDFATLSIPARVRLGYGTRHLMLVEGLETRRERLGLHVHEIQRALEGGPVVEDAGASDCGRTVLITGVTLRGRAVYLRVAADSLPMTMLGIDADEEAPLVPSGGV